MDVTFLPDALRVFHTNKEVNMYNNAMTTKAVKEGRQHVRLPFKVDVPKNQDYQREVQQLCDDMVYSKEIYVGSHVIITANMDVESGIVNGTVVRVIHIESDVPRDTPMYRGKELSLVITLQLDDQRIVAIGCHCISISKEIEKQRSHFQSNDVVKAYYVALLLRHAITVHRLQGLKSKRGCGSCCN